MLSVGWGTDALYQIANFDMSIETEKLRIHFFYSVLILVMIIIATATDRWTAKADFTQYLTNAATMTSLVLALVAIFYSFIANDGLSKGLGNISTVANEVKQSKDQIAEFLDLTTSSVNTARENTTELRAISGDVKQSLLALGETLTAIRAETGALNSSVSALPLRLDKLESNVLEAARSAGEKSPYAPLPSSERISDSLVDTFLRTTAVSANLLTLACVLAHSNNKDLSLAEFCSAIEDDRASYFSGFLACMHGVQLIKREIIEGKPGDYRIKWLHSQINATTQAYISEYLGRAYSDKPETRQQWMTKFEKVRALYQ